MSNHDLFNFHGYHDDPLPTIRDTPSGLASSTPQHPRAADPSQPTPEEAALTAAGFVSGERAEVYGNPVDQMESIAGLWNAFFSTRDPDRPLTGRDVAIMMTLFKIGREITPNSQHHADHLIDACGYASIAAACPHRTKRA